MGHRVVFIDLARAIAVVLMLYGHTVNALLDSRYQVGAWYEAWQFQRGLTSCLFLLLSGFAFSIATARHWQLHLTWSPALGKRLRRFGLLIVLGYGLHFPVPRFVLLPSATEAQWRALLGVDVLQLIGVTLLVAQLLVLVTRSRRVFAAVSLALAVVAVLATPWAWATDWSAHLPPALAAYLTPAMGSLFPLLPWAAYLLLGTALGQIYARWDRDHLTRYANRLLLVPGALMVTVGVSIRLLQIAFFDGPGYFVPVQFLIRAGSCLLLLGALAHASRRIGRLPHVFSAMAQETLVIYFVHLCLVYGSVWNPGLYQAFGATLGPVPVSMLVVLVVGSMAGLAWYWNWFKHLRPRPAKWVAIAAPAALVVKLF